MRAPTVSPELQTEIQPIEYRASELIDEFNQLKADAAAGVAPSVINTRYTRWHQKASEVVLC